MTSREVMMRTIESMHARGITDVGRLLKDAKIIHDAVMRCEDGPSKRGTTLKAPPKDD